MRTGAVWISLIVVTFLSQILSTTSSPSRQIRDLSQHQEERSGQGAHAEHVDIYENLFLDKIVEEYGTDGVVSVSQLRHLVNNIKSNSVIDAAGKKESSYDGEERTRTTTVSDSKPEAEVSVAVRYDQPDNCTDNNCWPKKCMSMVDIFEHHSLSPQDTANSSKLQRMSPTILYQLQNPHCSITQEPTKGKQSRPSLGEVLGFGFLCVTLINLCALMGMVFLPLMRRSFYKNMLLFMVALAVGTLTGSGLLFLIPEAFEMGSPESPHVNYYIWRSLTVVGGIYLFFLVERLLKMIIKRRQSPMEQDEMQDLPVASVPTHSVHLAESMNMSFKPIPDEIPSSVCKDKNTECLLRENSSSAQLVEQANAGAVGNNNLRMSNGHSAQSSPQHHGHSHGGTDLRDIHSVAWMVIFGDGLHNFIDGLSIGAAFSGSIMTGVSVSLAVICEELPHELGDFAILLNSGMTMKQALSYNFLSACMCYIGLIIGILVGEATHGAVWIFAVAGGMFLYIALVDMLPEVNHAAEEEEAATGATWSIFLIQNAGILTGIGIMVLLAVFSGRIDLSHYEE